MPCSRTTVRAMLPTEGTQLLAHNTNIVCLCTMVYLNLSNQLVQTCLFVWFNNNYVLKHAQTTVFKAQFRNQDTYTTYWFGIYRVRGSPAPQTALPAVAHRPGRCYDMRLPAPASAHRPCNCHQAASPASALRARRCPHRCMQTARPCCRSPPS